MCARDGDAAVSSSQQASFDRFSRHELRTDLPTMAAIRREAMAAVRSSARCPELDGALKFLEARNDTRVGEGQLPHALPL